MATDPTVKVEIDFTNAPTNATRSWTDVSGDVRELSAQRSGRVHELQRTEPGTITVVLDNASGDYDPTNTGGTYYPNVKQLRWLRYSLVWNGTTYKRWTGLVESWEQVWPGYGSDAVCAVTGVDAMKVLALYDLIGESYASQLTSARVAAVLASAGVNDSTVATGLTTVAASGTLPAQSFALAHLQAVEESEAGLIFAAGDGKIVFQDRHYRATAATSTTPQYVIGENAGDIRYREPVFVMNDDFLYNQAGVTPSGGSEETAENASSVSEYYGRRITRTILSASQTDALNHAQYLSSRYAEPSARLASVQLVGARDTDTWPDILSIENSYRLTFERDAAAAIATDVYVERVSDTVTRGGPVIVKLDVSPADDQAVWIVGDSINGLIGQTTIAGF